MDRQIENVEVSVGQKTVAKSSYSSGHLMCRTSLWGIAGFLGCAYFAWASFSHVTHNELEWPHDLWTVATYLVWILLLVGLALDTRCLRERLFFGVLVVNFIAGCALTLWHHVPPADVRMARIATGTLWVLAALLSLTTLGNRSQLDRNGGVK
jgi:hypothetical protein